LPTDRRAWAFLTGETIDPSVLPRWATRDEMLSLPAFGRGVELLASAVAGVDLVAQRWDADAGIWARLPDQPMILTDPDPTSTGWHWRYAATKDLVETGNHVALFGDVDWRTAAYMVALRRLERVYRDRGIFP
jgi:phage portal protein BeeE